MRWQGILAHIEVPIQSLKPHVPIYNFGQRHLSIKEGRLFVTLRYLKPQAPCYTFGN
jgi:hypothetical protein